MKRILVLLLITLLSNEAFANEFSCPTLFGKFKSEDDCQSYYLCIFGGSILKKCDNNCHFSEILNDCVLGPCVEVKKVNLTYSHENYENELERQKEMERLVEQHERERESERKEALKELEREQELKERERQHKLRERQRLQEYREQEKRRRELRERIERKKEQQRQREFEERVNRYRKQFEERRRERERQREQERRELEEELREKQREMNELKREMEKQRKEMDREQKNNVTAETVFLCPTLFGTYRNERDCSSFYLCVFGVSFPQYCEKNSHYSDLLNECVMGACVNDQNDDQPKASEQPTSSASNLSTSDSKVTEKCSTPVHQTLPSSVSTEDLTNTTTESLLELTTITDIDNENNSTQKNMTDLAANEFITDLDEVFEATTKSDVV